MKSGKQRKAEIKKARLDRIANHSKDIDLYSGPIPDHAVPVNKDEVVYNSMYFAIPLFYIDKEFICKDCGELEAWTAKQQKWWYEIAKGDLETTAIRCRSCRDIRKANKDKHQKHMEEVAKRKPHPNEAFFKKAHNKNKLATRKDARQS